jgi:hypothetical protein
MPFYWCISHCAQIKQHTVANCLMGMQQTRAYHAVPGQAASAARLMRAEDVRAAVRESADLGQWLGPKAHDLLAAPLEIIAFSDEEGVRRAPSLPSRDP